MPCGWAKFFDLLANADPREKSQIFVVSLQVDPADNAPSEPSPKTSQMPKPMQAFTLPLSSPQNFRRPPSSFLSARYLLISAAFLALLLFCVPNSYSQSAGGPPNAVIGGTLYGYSGSGQVWISDSSNPDGGYWTSADFYGSYYFNGGMYDSSGNSVSFTAIASDGLSYLNSPPGVIVLQQGGGDFWNGYAWVLHLYPSSFGYFQVGASPWYFFDGSNNRIVDASSGTWPTSDVPPYSWPQQVFVNGRTFNFQNTSQTGGSYFSETAYYQGPTVDEYVQIQREANAGGQAIGIR